MMAVPIYWFYLDDHDTEQGPFPSHQIEKWFNAKMFHPNVRFRRSQDKTWIKLGQRCEDSAHSMKMKKTSGAFTGIEELNEHLKNLQKTLKERRKTTTEAAHLKTRLQNDILQTRQDIMQTRKEINSHNDQNIDEHMGLVLSKSKCVKYKKIIKTCREELSNINFYYADHTDKCVVVISGEALNYVDANTLLNFAQKFAGVEIISFARPKGIEKSVSVVFENCSVYILWIKIIKNIYFLQWI